MVETADFHENFSRLLVTKPPTGGVTQRRNPYIIKEEETMKKRILSVLLALVMALSLCTVAMADPDGVTTLSSAEFILSNYYYGGLPGDIGVTVHSPLDALTVNKTLVYGQESAVLSTGGDEADATEGSWIGKHFGDADTGYSYYLKLTVGIQNEAGYSLPAEDVAGDALANYKLQIQQYVNGGTAELVDGTPVYETVTAVKVSVQPSDGTMTIYFKLPLEKTPYVYEIPFTKIVENLGNVDATDTVFSFEIKDFSDYSPGNENSWSSDYPEYVQMENGFTYQPGTTEYKLRVTGPRALVENFLKDGIFIHEVDRNEAEWQCDSQCWFVQDHPVQIDGNTTDLTFFKVDDCVLSNVPDCSGTHNTQLAHLTSMTFTNKYTKNVDTTPAPTPSRPHYTHTPTPTEKIEAPKTFDAGIAVYGVSALLSLTGSAWVVTRRRDR